MLRMTALLTALLTVLGSHGASLEGRQLANKEGSAKAKFEALVEEYEDVGNARKFAEKFLQFAEKNRTDPVAVDALAWVLTNQRFRPVADRALKLLKSQHLRSKHLSKAFESVAEGLGLNARRLLQAALKSSPHIDVQGQACFHLVALLDGQLRIAKQIRSQPKKLKRAEQYYGKTLTKHLLNLKVSQVGVEKERLCERMLKSFAKVKTDDGSLGEYAKKALFAMRHLTVGRTAPDIAGEDIGGRRFKLSNYRGKVVMLSFWGHW